MASGKIDAEEEKGAGETRREREEREGGREERCRGPLTRDTRHTKSTIIRQEKERERIGLCPVFVHETRSERWTIAGSFLSKRASAISIRRYYTRLAKSSRPESAPFLPIQTTSFENESRSRRVCESENSKTGLSEKSRISPERRSSR